MKTTPMKHQIEGERRLLAAPYFYALGAEQGTGKTWLLLNDAERQFNANMIDALLVIAPKGVHINWIAREIPTHLSVPCRAAFWLSGAGKKHQKKVDALMKDPDERVLTVLAANVDAVNTAAGFAFIREFLIKYRTMMVIDESQRIKNISSKRTKRIIQLGKLAHSRRIASGTLVANNPLDLFSQYEFLSPGLLGTTSFRAFTAQYAELLPDNHRLVQNIRGSRGSSPQIIQRDAQGNLVFRNLDRLARLMSPHTFRVLKKDCLDLPEKIYQTHYFDLSPVQMRLYKSLREDRNFIKPSGELDTFTALTVITKLRQVTSGFLMVDGCAMSLAESKPRLEALLDILEDVEGSVIVWASFKEELAQIAAALKDAGITAVEYHGDVNQKDRESAVDDFQAKRARVFLANPAAGGTGLTLTAATTVIYYSASFSLEERLQSEDRAHRIGTKSNVVYIDLVARDTIDEKIAQALQSKQFIASQILNNL